MYCKNIKPVFLVHAFNVKSVLCIVNCMLSNIYNRTPKSGMLFTNISIGDFFNRIHFLKHWVEVMFYHWYLWATIELNHRCEWLRAKRGCWMRPCWARRRSFNNLLLDQTNYVLYKCLKIYNRNMLTCSS